MSKKTAYVTTRPHGSRYKPAEVIRDDPKLSPRATGVTGVDMLKIREYPGKSYRNSILYAFKSTPDGQPAMTLWITGALGAFQGAVTLSKEDAEQLVDWIESWVATQ